MENTSVLNPQIPIEKYFEELSRIPRESENEEAVSAYIVRFAQEQGLSYTQDALWNDVIYKDASPDKQAAEPVILQAHMDMVCAKTAACPHDFRKDPIALHLEDGILTADGTTLGADDGFGAAYMLAVLKDDTLPQPPRFAEGYTALMGDGLCGAHTGIDLRDEQSDLLTINAGQLAVEEGEVRVYFDIRYPVTASGEAVLAQMRAAAAPYGLRMWKRHEMRPVYMDKNSRVIRSLLAAYREQTGDMGEPLVVGGGTYARAMKNIVAFGPGRPGRASAEHEADEHLPVEELLRLREIYRAALEKLLD